MNKPMVIAEIGCNHLGDFEIAKQLIKAAKDAGADVAKFQKRHNKTLLSDEEYHTPHPIPENSYGPTYGAHREFLEFTADQHRDLKAYCEELGIAYSTSVWELVSAKEIAALNPILIKIPSACNLNFEMLGWLADNYSGEIHLSFGMTSKEEEKKIIDFFEEKGKAKDVVVYACTSGYPVPFEDIALYEITRLRETFGDRVKSIGFSGHHLGIAADIAALALGATHIERHFTLDRTWKGTDHAASLEPQGLAKLCRDCAHVSLALAYKNEDILPIEQVQRKKLKRV